MNFTDWEENTEGIEMSPHSSEYWRAAQAWDAAVREAQRIVLAAQDAENTPQKLALLIHTELDNIMS